MGMHISKYLLSFLIVLSPSGYPSYHPGRFLKQLLRELRSVVLLPALLVFISLLATACGGGGDDSSSTTPTNLSATSIKIIDSNGDPVSSSTLQIGHPFRVELGIAATKLIEDVSVDFYIVDRESFGILGDTVENETTVEMTNYHVGSAFLGNLAQGLNAKTVDVTIPYTTEDIALDNLGYEDGETIYGGVVLVANREYYLFADIDPANLITETDEEDNRPSEANLDQTMAIVTVDDQWQDTPNLVLESILLEVPAFEVASEEQEQQTNSCGEVIVPDQPAVQNEVNSHLGVTAVINATGRYLPNYPLIEVAPIPRVDIQALLKTPGLSTVGDIQAMIWDSATQQYTDTLSITDIEPGTPMSVSLELRLPGTDMGSPELSLLVAELGTRASACVSSCDLDEFCFASELLSGDSCDMDDLNACGGSIIPGSPPVINDPDWSCFVERIDSACINQCNPDLNCIYSCAQELVDLELTITAYDAGGSPITEFEPDIIPDNNLQAQVIMLPAPDPGPPAETDPVLFETGFDKSFSAKLVYAGLSANTWAGLDGGGASAGLEAALPVVLFKGSPSACNPATQDCLLGYRTSEVFLGVRSSISALPALMPGTSLNSVDIYAFGQNLFPKVLDFSCGVMNVDELNQWNIGGMACARLCPPSLAVTEPGYLAREAERAQCLRDCWAFGKSKKVVTDFVIGVVPVTASFEAWGLIGAEVNLTLGGSRCANPVPPFTLFEAHTGPWAELGTEVSAGVGSSKAFSAGIGGELDPLLGDTFFATVAARDLLYDTEFNNVTGILHEDVTNTLTGPQGNVFFYVGYPCIKICRKWGIPYPCGFRQCKAKQPIVGFKTFVIEDVLFCADQPFSGPSE